MWFLTTLDLKSQPSTNDKGILKLLNFFTVVGYFDSRIAIPIKPLKMFCVQTKYIWMKTEITTSWLLWDGWVGALFSWRSE